VQIPLDYYRILGLPIQATAEQLQQAHRDRGLQLPRREFSVAAIEARKQLIDEAYTVLSDSDRRCDYDSKFLANAYTVDMAPDPLPEGRTTGLGVSADVGEAALRSLATEPGGSEAQSSKIDIEPDHLVGALLILLELGEYEQVLQLGQPQLSNPYASGAAASPDTGEDDVVLTLALACLELGREQWQQHQYEIAAESLQTGHELLARGNHFPAIRAEIQTELYKLRPYRILELLARPLDQTRERRQGQKLLKAMLEDRGGIEGTDDDLSGLAIDDFLRFIQQLRDYLTASEQQELFEHEARRPSPVATYLTVYALLARGFARHQPALVRRAKQLLLRLGGQQDVHLEQAVCALLLGQTEEANRALELSQEYEPLAYIREHSRQSPDLLPGLCLYAERWLKDELFPHFRDFKDQEATLKDYFADAQVQAYLEAMPVNSAPEPMRGPQFPLTGAAGPRPGEMGGTQSWGSGAADYPNAGYSTEFPTIEGSLPIGAPTLPNPTAGRRSTPPANGYGGYNDDLGRNGPVRPGQPSGGNRRPDRSGERLDSAGIEAADRDDLSVAERVAQLSPEGKMAAPGPAQAAAPPRRPKRRSTAVDTSLAPGQALPPSMAVGRSRGSSPNWGRLALVGVAGVAGLALLGFGTMRTLGWLAGAMVGPRLAGQPLDIRVDQPAFEIPEAPAAQAEIGVNDIASRAINEWLEVKQAALGKDYQADRLANILLDPVLTQWRRRADTAPAENWYWEYEHTVEVESVTPDDPTADQLRAIAIVSERARLFEFGVENTSASYDEVLRMQYDLVRQDGRWFVQGMTKLANLN
jgi:curved DNA-binding protein CbpA